MNYLNNIVTFRKPYADSGTNFFAFATEEKKILMQKLKYGGGGKIVKISPDKLKLSDDADKFTIKKVWNANGEAEYKVLSH